MTEESRRTPKIVSFYLGQQRDSCGRNIQEIWGWDFETLENTHDFIQWLFPLAEKSAYNPSAPLVDVDVIQAFHQNPQLQENLQRSLTVMLKFYGLQLQEIKPGKVRINRSETYPNRQSEWVLRSNHNFLRITRILKCLKALGLEGEAIAFYDCLQQIYHDSREQIGSETFRHWTNAVKR